MFTVVIQAGGESQRMGEDKGLVPFLGQPMIQRVVERFTRLADEILITTNHPGGYAFLNYPLVPDLRPGLGALGGLFTALSAAAHTQVGVVACDMPFASPQLLAAELKILTDTGCDAVVPRMPQGFEPFHAVYNKEACLPHILTALDAGKRRVDAWFAQVNIHHLMPDECLQYDPQQIAFWNVNTHEELLEAERKASEVDG